MPEQLKASSAEDFALHLLAEEEQERSNPAVGELVAIPNTKLAVRLKRADPADMVLVGPLTRSLVETATKAMAEQGKMEKPEEEDDETPKTPDPEMVKQGTARMIQMRDLVVRNCLEPRLRDDELHGVSFVSAEGKVIAPVKPEHFTFMLEWITGSRGYADGLDSFRNRRERRAAASRTRRKKSGDKAEPVPVDPLPA
jgi:hypothetical protein